MAANYLEVQKQLEDMRKYKQELEEELEKSDIEMKKVAEETNNEEAKKFLQLQKEKVYRKSSIKSRPCIFLDSNFPTG